MSKKTFAFSQPSEQILFSLSQFLLQSPVNQDTEAYVYEAKCQLLMYTAIAMIKLNMIVSDRFDNLAK